MAGLPFPDISPEIFSLTLGGFTLALRWYALAYIFGLLLAWALVRQAVKTPRLWAPGAAPLTPLQVEAFVTWAILGVILGGRLGYVFFYQFADYLARPGDIVKVWQGGMSFHGGFLGVVLAAFFFFRRERVPLWTGADLLAMATPLALFLGRCANFINAELWGRPTDLPWGVRFPGAAAESCPGLLPGICARHPSQLYEAVLEGLLLGTLVLFAVWRWDWLRRPGRVTGLFFAGYGLARFAVEFARQPDAQFITPGNPLGLALHLQGWGLTMGQLLSLPMIGMGLWLLARRPRGRRAHG